MERSEEKLSGDFVLDSSVIVKWFCQEEYTALALKFREGYVLGYVNITFPDLVIYEIANALRYNQKVTEDDVKNSVNSLIDLGINIIVPTKKITESAISIAFEYDITLYDAYFVALAKELGFQFVTADENFYKKIRELKFVNLLENIQIKQNSC